MISTAKQNFATRGILAATLLLALLFAWPVATLERSYPGAAATESIPEAIPHAVSPETRIPRPRRDDALPAVADRHPGRFEIAVTEMPAIEALPAVEESRDVQADDTANDAAREAVAAATVRVAAVSSEPRTQAAIEPETPIVTARPAAEVEPQPATDIEPLFSSRRPRAIKVARILSEETVGEAIRTAPTTVAEPAERYQRLDRNGRIVTADQPWSCVRDTRSDLVWEVKTSDGGLHDAAHLYSWFDPSLGRDAGVRDGGRCAGGVDCDTHAYQAALNRQKLCGLDEWRLPSKQELQTLVVLADRGDGATIDRSYFPGTAASWYWSASSNDMRPGYAWYVLFRNGIPLNDLKARPKHLRLVSGTRLIMASRD